MILVGNVRGNGQNLARHLMSSENEHVTLHDISGFASDDLGGALKEVEATSKGTKCQKYLYSLSLNPPANAKVGTSDFESAIEQAEKRLGLAGQPRAVVFHEKDDRRHCHVVWSRIDTESMKAIPISFPKLKLKELAKDLYLEHGWDLPKGFINPKFRDPKNFTLAEWQQAKRQGQDPREMKAIFQSCWKQSDDRRSFANGLEEHGLILARGDRRGYVATDIHGEIYAVAKWASIKTKDVRARLGDKNTLPSIENAKKQLADALSPALERLKKQQTEKLDKLSQQQKKMLNSLAKKHSAQRQLQSGMQEQRTVQETRARQERYNKGLRGLFDRLTGTHSQIKKQNAFEAYQSAKRDQKQRDDLIFKQMEQKRAFRLQTQRDLDKFKGVRSQLQTDLERLKASRTSKSNAPRGPER
ncbi:hypothetical protein LPB140_10485 [Sphingorhabdus lutea]|uniref:MobA/VirD2-like nuclease domain-containing protein n=1 Tax=Sphingorhabdus lutea TaxID=1913578 RepID=A0A1L3JDE4_9SPHN|nr:relaxase/mobilization nuclease domain-containing protein [Sphingorhabdus lutea]APG63144.1 hypothetical protein LPB140_10485 [Sphingorhabdus lutea]